MPDQNFALDRFALPSPCACGACGACQNAALLRRVLGPGRGRWGWWAPQTVRGALGALALQGYAVATVEDDDA